MQQGPGSSIVLMLSRAVWAVFLSILLIVWAYLGTRYVSIVTQIGYCL